MCPIGNLGELEVQTTQSRGISCFAPKGRDVHSRELLFSFWFAALYSATCFYLPGQRAAGVFHSYGAKVFYGGP
jgi:hypothetical protein